MQGAGGGRVGNPSCHECALATVPAV